MKNTIAAAIVCASLIALTASPATAAPFYFHVNVNTASLIGSPSAPFALDFQLTGGTPNANSVSIFNFNFGGGSATGAATPFAGLASGNLTNGIVLKDDSTHFFNELYQGFTPGASLAFDLLISGNVNAPNPDAFGFAILDNALANIPTTGFGDQLFVLNLSSPLLTMANAQVFRGTGAFANVTVSAVPEPVSLLLLGAGLASVGVRRLRRGRATVV